MKFSALASSSALALALALGLSACGDEDAGAGRDRPAATEITQEEGEAGLAALNLEQTPQLSWQDRRFEDGVFTFSELAFTPEGGGEGFTIEQLVLAAPRVNEAGTVEFDRLEALGLVAGEGEEEVRVARAFVDYPGPGLAAAIADMLSGRAADEAYEVNVDDMTRFTFEGVGVEGVEMSATEELESLSITGFTFEAFDGETLGAMVMSGFSMSAEDETGAPVHLGLGEFRVEGLDGALFKSMADAEGDPQAAMEAMSNWMMPTNLYDNFALRDLDVNAAGVRIAMPEMTSQVRERGQEVVMTSAMPSLTITGEPGTQGGAQIAQALEMLGYESFDLSMRGESVYDQETGRVTTRGDNYVELEDGLRISITQDIGGFNEYLERYSQVMGELFAQAETAGELGALDPQINAMMLDLYDPLMLHSMTVAIEDRSILQRGIDAAAAQQGVTPEDVRSQLVGLIGMGVMMAPPEVPRPLVSSLSQSLMSFVQQGGTLVISADPEEPVSLGAVIDAAQAGNFDPGQIGLTVAHEGGEAGGE
ncbi:hypothetical protein E5163_07455 [Marinicauda algicola]|uniref:DUF945 domain-containing protein n=1 Tax=Marinicauda algicola TaxID=2029849 RepID=A0A4S2H1B6_9PROT|nr:hypothetical protein [Marinicauda algicola]TGY88962.1 hypothetical protein E5163_07455 [Marinicauda algicola]